MATRIFDETGLGMVKQVLDSGQLCSHGGTMVKRFEEAFASRLGVTHAVAVNAAMSGLHAALMASGVGPGVEVIVDPIVQFAGLSVLYANGVPVFADIDPATLNIDPTSVASRITPHTRVIVVTHLCGLPAEMDPLLELARPVASRPSLDDGHARRDEPARGMRYMVRVVQRATSAASRARRLAEVTRGEPAERVAQHPPLSAYS